MELKKTYEKQDIHEEWESVYRQNPLQNNFNAKMMDRVIKYLNPLPNALFLDAGCGTAHHSMRIVDKGYKCIGVDISETILKRAKINIRGCKLNRNIFFSCSALESLAFKDEIFDVVYCRGVLMHIPNWERALSNLCGALKPGGRIIIMESNHRSIETFIVLLVRGIIKRESRLTRTKGGLEFWSDRNGDPFVVRMANMGYLMQQLKNNNIRIKKIFSTEFWDINRFPSGIIRNIIIKYNYLWFYLGLPRLLCMGNAIIGEKKKGDVSTFT